MSQCIGILVAFDGHVKRLDMIAPINGRTVRRALSYALGVRCVCAFSWMREEGTRYHSVKALARKGAA